MFERPVGGWREHLRLAPNKHRVGVELGLILNAISRVATLLKVCVLEAGLVICEAAALVNAHVEIAGHGGPGDGLLVVGILRLVSNNVARDLFELPVVLAHPEMN